MSDGGGGGGSVPVPVVVVVVPVGRSSSRRNRIEDCTRMTTNIITTMPITTVRILEKKYLVNEMTQEYGFRLSRACSHSCTMRSNRMVHVSRNIASTMKTAMNLARAKGSLLNRGKYAHIRLPFPRLSSPLQTKVHVTPTGSIFGYSRAVSQSALPWQKETPSADAYCFDRAFR